MKPFSSKSGTKMPGETMPTHESFGTDGKICRDIVDGMKLDMELAVLERVFHIVENVLLLEHALGELGIVVGDMTIIVPFDRVARHHGMIEHDAGLDAVILDAIDAGNERGREVDVALREEGADFIGDAFDDVFDIGFALFEAKGEVVVSQTSIDLFMQCAAAISILSPKAVPNSSLKVLKFSKSQTTSRYFFSE